MTDKKIALEYAKNKILLEELTEKVKLLEKEMYGVMVEQGEQTIGKKTYTYALPNYEIQMTETASSETVDWKSIALELLGTDEANGKIYAKKHNFVTSRNGSVKYKVKAR